MSTSTKRTKIQKVTFTCHAPEAVAVFLAGDFNGWDPQAAPMTRGEEGTWTAALDLKPGHYEYKFVVDSQWCCEPGCAGTNYTCPACVPNPFGSMNRVVEVGEE